MYVCMINMIKAHVLIYVHEDEVISLIAMAHNQNKHDIYHGHDFKDLTLELRH